ncbi:MAG: Crp/Fnr family transcriptional regulator [Alphaproteobacteria bacterium]|nr:Crp/Fnr family transcriptional regulator [Alphaproteobacteria bacterium]
MHKLPPQLLGSKRPQLFSGLTEASLQKLLTYAVTQEHGPNHILVQQGDIPDGVYLVLEGEVRTLRSNEGGEEASIRLLEVGDTCMEAVLFMSGPSPISVQSLTQSRVMMIPARIIKQHVLDDSHFALNIISIVSHHYRNAMHQIDAMNIKTPLQRVGYYFLEKHLEAGHDSLEFTLPFRKQTVANYLGITAETFSRVLKQMRDLGISVENDTIRMKDAFSLCHFCDSDTEALCDRKDKDNCKHCIMHSKG